jgi:hypothetical protein
MEVRPVMQAGDRGEAEGACEELRAHNIKCDIFEPTLPDFNIASMYTLDSSDPGIQVVVAPEDEERAKKILGTD